MIKAEYNSIVVVVEISVVVGTALMIMITRRSRRRAMVRVIVMAIGMIPVIIPNITTAKRNNKK